VRKREGMRRLARNPARRSPRRGRGAVRIGCSGYMYDHWQRLFYPADLPRSRWFEHYASHFDVVEINNTFYRLPEAATFDDWRRRAPPGFEYALKLSRYGTHMKRLKEPARWLRTFLRGAERLRSRLGPILVQLPPHWHADPERLDLFLRAAPKRRRWAVEFRDASWLCDDVYAVLAKHGAALCIHDLIEHHPLVVTADWVYLRFHGGRTGCYSPQALTAHARRIAGWAGEGRDVYAFFNNDLGGHAVTNAQQLRRYVAKR